MWSKQNYIGRMIPGKGNSGFPYIHRYELVRIVRRVIEKSDSLFARNILSIPRAAICLDDAIFGKRVGRWAVRLCAAQRGQFQFFCDCKAPSLFHCCPYLPSFFAHLTILSITIRDSNQWHSVESPTRKTWCQLKQHRQMI